MAEILGYVYGVAEQGLELARGQIGQVFEEMREDLLGALDAVRRRWTAIVNGRQYCGEDVADGDVVREAEGHRLVLLKTLCDQDLASVHDGVVRRLRRRRYKTGWKIKTAMRLVPQVWSGLLPEFRAVGADVVTQGNTVVVTFVDPGVLSNVFFVNRLVRGGSKYCGVHGVFVKYFSLPAEYPHSAVIVSVQRPFVLEYRQAKKELTILCSWEHVDEDHQVVA